MATDNKLHRLQEKKTENSSIPNGYCLKAKISNYSNRYIVYLQETKRTDEQGIYISYTQCVYP